MDTFYFLSGARYALVSTRALRVTGGDPGRDVPMYRGSGRQAAGVGQLIGHAGVLSGIHHA
jgi:hypothetical protein